jgi:hypothetical protein
VLGPPGDDKIYCIPSDADTVLVIDPVNGDEVTFLGEGIIPKNTKDKWQVGLAESFVLLLLWCLQGGSGLMLRLKHFWPPLSLGEIQQDEYFLFDFLFLTRGRDLRDSCCWFPND